MNYYYDPILGLQYTYLGVTLFFDIEKLPENLSVLSFMRACQRWANFSSTPEILPPMTYCEITEIFIL